MVKKLEKIIEIVEQVIQVKGRRLGPFYTANTNNGIAITSALKDDHLYESLRLKGYTKKEIDTAKRRYQDDNYDLVDSGPEYWSQWW